MPSSISITFNNDFSLGRTLILIVSDVNTSERLNLNRWDWVVSRSNPFEVTVETPSASSGNILLYSEDVSETAWIANQLEFDLDAIAVGSYFGDRIVATSSNAPHWITQTINKDNTSKSYTASFYVKAAEYNRAYFRISDSTGTSVICHFNTIDQTFTNIVEDAGYTNVSRGFTDEGDGWYRVYTSFDSTTNNEIDFVVGIVNDNDSFLFSGDNLNGVNLSGLYIRGFQLNEGVLGDYKPTTSTINTGDTSGDGSLTAAQFKNAFDLDFPSGFTTSVVFNTVTLVSNNIGFDFINVLQGRDSQGDIDTVITNELVTENQNKIKYYISYCDDFNTQRNVFILKKGYTGGATELLADTNPIEITYESSDDFKFSPIRPSIAEVFMVFDSEGVIDFEEFWTADEKDFKVEDVKDNVTEWSGYVTTGGFEYEFKGGKYYATIQASDGLGSLEALTFVDDNLKPYGNQDLVYNNGFEFPFSLIITEILKKLELDLDLWTCVDSYEQSMTKIGDVREADPLSAAYVNVKTYIKLGEDESIPYWYGSGEEWNCKEVLENILYMFGAKIYQEFGVWRVKTVNADIDYGAGDTQKYWRKYNTVGTYLGGYEILNDERNIPCNDKTKFLVGNDHVMSMDDVYKAFRMNYEYTLLRDGDDALNLLENGNFDPFDDSSVFSAPIGWARVKALGTSDFMRLNSVNISFLSPSFLVFGETTKVIEIGRQKTGTSITGTTNIQDPNRGLVNTPAKIIKNGDRVFFEIWNKYIYRISGGITINNGTYTMMYRLVLISEPDSNGEYTKYFLRNNADDINNGFSWETSTSKNTDVFDGTSCFYLLADKADNYNSANDTSNFWYNHKHEFPDAPISGYLYFIIHGIAVRYTNKGGDFFVYPTYTLINGFYSPSSLWRVSQQTPEDSNSPLVYPQIAKAFLGIIPSGNDLPEQQDYIYNNENKNYSLQVDPITVYNGDVQDAKHVSNIIVPTNTTGLKNFWDDLSNSYGTSSLGLLTVREIMRQYQKPYRILEGNLKIQDARFGSVYTFETIPNVRFVLQRGSFNKQKQYIENASFVQLASDVLPNGGFEGGNTLGATWVTTGNSYCEVGEDALNTGFVIVEEQDINPNSETYQDTREIVSDSQDLTQCPLNTPRLYYWNTDDVFLNLDVLKFSPYVEVSSKEIQIQMDNEDGNYLYFVHLKSLGVIDRIYTNTSPNNVLSDWVYLEDVVIDGYIYRVLRTDYVMTQFTGFTHNFKLA